MTEGLGGAGVLASQQIAKAHASGWILSPPLDDRQIQPASLDLRLGPHAHRLRCSFLPGPNATVEERLPAFEMGAPLDIESEGIIERGRPYLIRLQESLGLPPSVSGIANPKSSTGRLDIFTRLVTDRGESFDEIPAGYHGPLYLELLSRSFTISVRSGLPLNQLRLTHGPVRQLDGRRLTAIHKTDPLLMYGRKKVARLPVGADGLFLSLDLAASKTKPRQVGWKAKKNSNLLRLDQIGTHVPRDFWEPVFAEDAGGIVLEPEEFYLLLSREGVRIPPGYASEMTAFDPTSGELRTHYAGFFDPGFGHSQIGFGSRAALEVRAHDVPFKVEHGQRVCKLIFFEMAARPDDLYGEHGSNYQFQSETLSKHFVRNAEARVVAPSPVASDAEVSAIF